METFCGLSRRGVRQAIFTAYLLYFASLGVGIVLYAVEGVQDFLKVVTISVPILHFGFILFGVVLRKNVTFFDFYEIYPDSATVPKLALYASDWLLAFAFGLALATHFPLEDFGIAASILVMFCQIACLAK